MKKIKKFIDFEIVTILAIIIVMATFYFIFKYVKVEQDLIAQDTFIINEYQIVVNLENIAYETNESEIFKVQVMDLENNLIYNSNSDFELIAIITASINIVVVTIYIILMFLKFLILNRNKKIVYKDTFIDEIELPQYDILIANTLYTGRISFSKIYNFLHEHFRKNEMIDKKGKIDSNVNIDNLSDLEKEFIYLYEKEVGKEVKEQFKNKIINELENRKYLKSNRLRSFIDYFGRKIDKIVLDVYNLDKYNMKRTFIETIFPITLLVLIAIFKYFSIILIIAIAYVQLKYYTIFLTEEGRKEKAKIILLVEKLKNKEELTEKEKFFYDVLKFINL